MQGSVNKDYSHNCSRLFQLLEFLFQGDLVSFPLNKLCFHCFLLILQTVNL